MKWVLLFLLIALQIPHVSAQEFNAGFIKGLWYSEETVFVDEPVRIYVAIRNNTGADLTGRVEFYDNDELIERNNVSALDGRIIESWADWTPSYGEHTLSASLSRIELSKVGSSTKAIEVTSSIAEDLIFVDYDTDKDGVGNEDDIDDDGDGIRDTVEEKNGTDPLVFDEEEEIATEEEVTADDDSLNDEADKADVSENSSGQGLEQYLTPSPAHSALSSVTDIVHTTKRNLDAYRESRQVAQIQKDEPEDVEVNEDGFGEITRTKNDKLKVETPDMPEIKSGGFLDSTLAVIGNIWNALYTVVLATISFYLGHPMFVQLTILFGILFALYKLARKFGKRPS